MIPAYLKRIAGGLAVLAVLAGDAGAQLRPLDPLDWNVLGRTSRTAVMGGGFLGGQRASQAGTTGRLLELGAFRLVWSLDRVALEFSGTLLRIFTDQTVFASPVGSTRESDGTRRVDFGDARVSTVVQLTAPGSRVAAALRFGVRLPTTDDVVGLGRDQTDFFSTLAGRLHRGPWDVGAEVGMAVNGTRDPLNEQVDPFVFGVSARYDLGSVDPVLVGVGQHDPRAGGDRRGTENLGEARLGVHVGERRWLRVVAIRGWTPVSPDYGVSVSFGTRF